MFRLTHVIVFLVSFFAKNYSLILNLDRVFINKKTGKVEERSKNTSLEHSTGELVTWKRGCHSWFPVRMQGSSAAAAATAVCNHRSCRCSTYSYRPRLQKRSWTNLPSPVRTGSPVDACLKGGLVLLH
ncbi:hypothetical protein JOB18_035897 [Solea senegalensis]|uniref:Secreted protein n=1 Tax=Solea senegalensis TaxID=28829 RepID=A0AAV6QPA1_SOLSE|nr:hypothetical protein JOB18_035897 [Solea senegalensis]